MGWNNEYIILILINPSEISSNLWTLEGWINLFLIIIIVCVIIFFFPIGMTLEKIIYVIKDAMRKICKCGVYIRHKSQLCQRNCASPPPKTVQPYFKHRSGDYWARLWLRSAPSFERNELTLTHNHLYTTYTFPRLKI